MHAFQIHVRKIKEPLIDVVSSVQSISENRPVGSPAKPAPAAATCRASSRLSCDGTELLFCGLF